MLTKLINEVVSKNNKNIELYGKNYLINKNKHYLNFLDIEQFNDFNYYKLFIILSKSDLIYKTLFQILQKERAKSNMNIDNLKKIQQEYQTEYQKGNYKKYQNKINKYKNEIAKNQNKIINIEAQKRGYIYNLKYIFDIYLNKDSIGEVVDVFNISEDDVIDIANIYRISTIGKQIDEQSSSLDNIVSNGECDYEFECKKIKLNFGKYIKYTNNIEQEISNNEPISDETLWILNTSTLIIFSLILNYNKLSGSLKKYIYEIFYSIGVIENFSEFQKIINNLFDIYLGKYKNHVVNEIIKNFEYIIKIGYENKTLQNGHDFQKKVCNNVLGLGNQYQKKEIIKGILNIDIYMQSYCFNYVLFKSDYTDTISLKDYLNVLETDTLLSETKNTNTINSKKIQNLDKKKNIVYKILNLSYLMSYINKQYFNQNQEIKFKESGKIDVFLGEYNENPVSLINFYFQKNNKNNTVDDGYGKKGILDLFNKMTNNIILKNETSEFVIPESKYRLDLVFFIYTSKYFLYFINYFNKSEDFNFKHIDEDTLELFDDNLFVFKNDSTTRYYKVFSFNDSLFEYTFSEREFDFVRKTTNNLFQKGLNLKNLIKKYYFKNELHSREVNKILINKEKLNTGRDKVVLKKPAQKQAKLDNIFLKEIAYNNYIYNPLHSLGYMYGFKDVFTYLFIDNSEGEFDEDMIMDNITKFSYHHKLGFFMPMFVIVLNTSEQLKKGQYKLSIYINDINVELNHKDKNFKLDFFNNYLLNKYLKGDYFIYINEEESEDEEEEPIVKFDYVKPSESIEGKIKNILEENDIFVVDTGKVKTKINKKVKINSNSKNENGVSNDPQHGIRNISKLDIFINYPDLKNEKGYFKNWFLQYIKKLMRTILSNNIYIYSPTYCIRYMKKYINNKEEGLGYDIPVFFFKREELENINNSIAYEDLDSSIREKISNYVFVINNKDIGKTLFEFSSYKLYMIDYNKISKEDINEKTIFEQIQKMLKKMNIDDYLFIQYQVYLFLIENLDDNFSKEKFKKFVINEYIKDYFLYTSFLMNYIDIDKHIKL